MPPLPIAENICTKFEPKIILSQEPEDLQRRLTCQNNWREGLTMSMAPSCWMCVRDEM